MFYSEAQHSGRASLEWKRLQHRWTAKIRAELVHTHVSAYTTVVETLSFSSGNEGMTMFTLPNRGRHNGGGSSYHAAAIGRFSISVRKRDKAI